MTSIKHKNSTVAGNAPSAGDLEVAELAVNLADKKLYCKDNNNQIFRDRTQRHWSARPW